MFFSHHLRVVHIAQLYYFEDKPSQKQQALMYSPVFRRDLIDWSEGVSTSGNCNCDDNDKNSHSSSNNNNGNNNNDNNSNNDNNKMIVIMIIEK